MNFSHEMIYLPVKPLPQLGPCNYSNLTRVITIDVRWCYDPHNFQYVSYGVLKSYSLLGLHVKWNVVKVEKVEFEINAIFSIKINHLLVRSFFGS